ncbi:MAG TPA: malate synthase A, partial [Candidatus Limnocylindria bacterium]
MALVDISGIEVTAPEGVAAEAEEVLNPQALAFVAQLHRSFNPRRQRLLADRRARQKRFDSGELPDFLPNTRHVREDPTWRVAPAP